MQQNSSTPCWVITVDGFWLNGDWMTALKPLNFPVTRNKGMLSTKYDPFRIEADAETLEDLRTLVGMALGVGWERYALTEDSDLNERGLKLKAELLAAFKKEE